MYDFTWKASNAGDVRLTVGGHHVWLTGEVLKKMLGSLSHARDKELLAVLDKYDEAPGTQTMRNTLDRDFMVRERADD